jgi:hypothetical protein
MLQILFQGNIVTALANQKNKKKIIEDIEGNIKNYWQA